MVDDHRHGRCGLPRRLRAPPDALAPPLMDGLSTFWNPPPVWDATLQAEAEWASRLAWAMWKTWGLVLLAFILLCWLSTFRRPKP